MIANAPELRSERAHEIVCFVEIGVSRQTVERPQVVRNLRAVDDAVDLAEDRLRITLSSEGAARALSCDRGTHVFERICKLLIGVVEIEKLLTDVLVVTIGTSETVIRNAASTARRAR